MDTKLSHRKEVNNVFIFAMLKKHGPNDSNAVYQMTKSEKSTSTSTSTLCETTCCVRSFVHAVARDPNNTGLSCSVYFFCCHFALTLCCFNVFNVFFFLSRCIVYIFT